MHDNFSSFSLNSAKCHELKIFFHFQDLTEEIANHQSQVDGTVDSGLELMKHISNDEALQLKDKLDLLQRRFNDLTTRGADLLKHAQVCVVPVRLYIIRKICVEFELCNVCALFVTPAFKSW